MFWICPADASGNRLVGLEEMLSPAPAEVDYPTEAAGVKQDTSDGRVVLQQPSADPRMRAWVWHNMPAYIPRFKQFVLKLESLRSRTRRQQGLSPYVFLKDSDTEAFRIWDFQSGTASAVSANTLSDGSKGWTTDQLKNGTVEIVSGTGQGQRRTIASNTNNTITLTSNWTTQPTGAHYAIQTSVDTWLRCRVLEVSKKITGRGGVTFDPVRVAFVIDDPSFSDLG